MAQDHHKKAEERRRAAILVVLASFPAFREAHELTLRNPCVVQVGDAFHAPDAFAIAKELLPDSGKECGLLCVSLIFCGPGPQMSMHLSMVVICKCLLAVVVTRASRMGDAYRRGIAESRHFHALAHTSSK